MLLSSAAQSLLGFSVPPNICDDYDELDVQEFKAVINFLVAIYRECCNKKSVLVSISILVLMLVDVLIFCTSTSAYRKQAIQL